MIRTVTLATLAAAGISYAQMGPAEYGQAVGAGFQNSYQNVLMGLQAGREQRQLDLQYRQQELYERQAALDRQITEQNLEMARQRIDLIKRTVKMNDDLEKRIRTLLEERMGKESANSPGSSKEAFPEPKGHWPKVAMPDSLKVAEREIIDEINRYREMVDSYAISGNFRLAQSISLKEPDMTKFPISLWPEIYILMNQEVERYKSLVLSSFKN